MSEPSWRLEKEASKKIGSEAGECAGMRLVPGLRCCRCLQNCSPNQATNLIRDALTIHQINPRSPWSEQVKADVMVRLDSELSELEVGMGMGTDTGGMQTGFTGVHVPITSLVILVRSSSPPVSSIPSSKITEQAYRGHLFPTTQALPT